MGADLSTVSAYADKLLRVEHPEPTLIDLELQASRDVDLPVRALRYAVLAYERHRLPVLSLIVLMRREADFPGLNGTLSFQALNEGSLDFRYRVVRLWELPAEWALEGGLGTVPLTPLTRDAPADLGDMYRRMDLRLEGIETPTWDNLWLTTYILMGVRYPEELCRPALGRVRSMKDSVSYQTIFREVREESLNEGVEKGRAQEARRMVLRQGERRYGSPSEAVRLAFEALSLSRLEELGLRLLDAESWDELLAE